MKEVSVSLLAGGNVFHLDGRSGIGMAEWPQFLDGLATSTMWDEESGLFRGEGNSGTTDANLDLVVKGRDVSRTVSLLLDSLRADEGLCTVAVWSKRGGHRRKELRFVEAGSTAWYPAPYSACQADVPLRFEAGNALWAGGKYEHTPAPAEGGRAVVPYRGDVTAWPVLTVQPGAGEVQVRLREEDDPLVLPNNGSGWRVETAPGRQGVADGAGARLAGFVPFWPEPPELPGDGMTLYLEGDVGSVKVEVEELWRKAWA